MAAKKKKPDIEEEELVDGIDDEDDSVLGPDVTLQTLLRTVPRATRFIGALAASSLLRALLAQRGFTLEDLADGRSRLMAVLTPTPSPDASKKQEAMAEDDAKVARAVKAVDDLDEGHYAIAQRTLVVDFPAQYKALFTNLTASTGHEAVAGWRTFLTRIDTLRKSKDPTDKAALERLAKRGLHETELKRIEKLVVIAEGAKTEVFTLDGTEDEEVSPARLASLVALRAWFMEWLTVAKVEVKQKRLRILLGISKRKRSGGGNGGGAPPV